MGGWEWDRVGRTLKRLGRQAFSQQLACMAILQPCLLCDRHSTIMPTYIYVSCERGARLDFSKLQQPSAFPCSSEQLHFPHLPTNSLSLFIYSLPLEHFVLPCCLLSPVYHSAFPALFCFYIHGCVTGSCDIVSGRQGRYVVDCGVFLPPPPLLVCNSICEPSLYMA